MPEDYPDKLLLVNMVPFSHSLQAVNLESDWLLFEGSQPRRAPHTKIASDYRPRFKVNIGVLSSWYRPVSFVFYCAAHVHVCTFLQTANLTGGKKMITSQLSNCFADINQKVGCWEDNKFQPFLRELLLSGVFRGVWVCILFSVLLKSGITRCLKRTFLWPSSVCSFGPYHR